jgi:hypothetical protein
MRASTYLNIQKILLLTINLMVAVVKCRAGVSCPLKNSTYCKFFYRHHHLTSYDRSNVSERESRTSQGILEAKGAEKFHIAGGMPALIWCGGMPNQIGTRSSTKNLNLTGNDFSSWARRHAVCYQRYRAWPALPTGTSSFPKALRIPAITYC